MRGVPEKHTAWICRRYADRHACIRFDDFVSELFAVDEGLDQGDPQSGICYLIYNSGLAEIPKPKKKEHGLVFVDNNTTVAVARTFEKTHTMLKDVMQHLHGVNHWGVTHNAEFGPPKFQLLDASRQ
ncbi:hypothetical protein B0H10DRAFT_1657787, partial [Mycena sp. CBHHK59/15]